MMPKLDGYGVIAALRASQTIKDLLTLGRQGRTTKEPVDLNALVQACLDEESLRSQPKSNVSIRVELSPTPLVVHASEAHIVRAVTNALKPSGKPFQFFNGLPTAEVSQQAYRAIGVTLYSSATFAFAPELALAFYGALERDDEDTVAALLREFFHPLVRLRTRCPATPVAIKAGVTMEGLDAGPSGRR
jgi:hypothetical protein